MEKKAFYLLKRKTTQIFSGLNNFIFFLCDGFLFTNNISDLILYFIRFAFRYFNFIFKYYVFSIKSYLYLQ